MWIVNQGKTKLIDCYQIERTEEYIYGINEKGTQTLASYETDRAAEIMKEIETAIRCKISVYEMPEE